MSNDQISRRLTKILRHSALSDALPMRSDGFIALEALLKHPQLSRVTLDQIYEIVDHDPKERFKLFSDQDGIQYIRANQGHSMALELDLEQLKDPSQVPMIVHGTFKSKLPSILAQGLKTMGRQHIHFATGLPGSEGVISGMRVHAQVYIYINVSLAMKGGSYL